MKIVHLETGRHLYGGARQVCHLLDALTDVDNVLVCRPNAAIAEHVGAHVRVVAMPLHGDLDPGARARLRELLAEENPDVLHVHSRAGADHFGGRAAKSLGVRAVLTRRVDNPEPLAWARHKFRSYDAIAAISSPIARWLRETIRIPGQQVKQIASGVDVAAFTDRDAARSRLARRFGVDLTEPVIAAAGQLIARKGHDVLLDALPAILERRPGLRVILFGRGARERSLRRQAARLGIEANVVFAGFVPGLEQLLAGFDLFVHPARMEGLGLVVLEALAAGLPVVASRAGGIVDAIDDGRTGLLVTPNDPRALAAAVLRMLADAPLRERLAAAGHAGVAARFSVPAMAGAYRRLYAGVLSGARACSTPCRSAAC